MRVDSHGVSLVGRRKNNEDNLLVDRELRLFAVADGMGGYEGGEVASGLVVETLARFFADYRDDEEMTWPFALDQTVSLMGNMIRAAVLLAHKRVMKRRHGALSQMGSTVAMLVLREDRAFIGHLGDSRVYRLRGGDLEALTRDHSLVEEMRSMPNNPWGPEAEARYKNVITKAVGVSTGEVSAELREVEVEPGDVFLLCTDGLLESVSEAQIRQVLLDRSPEAASQILARMAYRQGANDNITTVVLEMSAEGPPSEDAA